MGAKRPKVTMLVVETIFETVSDPGLRSITELVRLCPGRQKVSSSKGGVELSNVTLGGGRPSSRSRYS